MSQIFAYFVVNRLLDFLKIRRSSNSSSTFRSGDSIPNANPLNSKVDIVVIQLRVQVNRQSITQNP